MMIDGLMKFVFGERDAMERTAASPGSPRLSAWLPYRSFDPATGLFFNEGGSGFFLEVTPLIGANERIADILTQWLSEGFQPATCLQILHYMSPRVGDLITRWFLPRYAAGGIYEAMAQHRSAHLSNGVWNSLSKDAPFHLRHHRVFISVSVPSAARIAPHDLVSLRETMEATLKSIDIGSRRGDPLLLITLIDDLLSPTTAPGDDQQDYSPYNTIASQCIRKDAVFQHSPERIVMRTERFRPTGAKLDGIPEIGEIYPDHFDVRSFNVRNMPSHWAPWDTIRLIGDLYTDKLRYPCPIATTMCVQFQDDQAAATKASYKFMRTTSLADTQTAKWLPHVRDQKADWEIVQDELVRGRKLVRVYYGVTAFSKLGEGDRDERSVKSIYRAAGWDLIKEPFMQMNSLIALMPMAMGSGLSYDFDRMKRFHTMLTTTAANLAPLQGEYLGGAIPHILLIGRRGQPFYWSPYQNDAGNHNTSIIGKSGSGKSVFLQELCAAMCGAKSKVIVIDDGRSFMRSCLMQGGAFVEFTMNAGFRLNIFKMIDAPQASRDEDYLLECLSMIKVIVSQMARHQDRLDDVERGIIDGVVNKVWRAHGPEGTIDALIKALEDEQLGPAKALALSMRAFSSRGTFGRFFMGEASFKLDADFTVFELSDLAAHEELRSVVLTTIMFMSTQMMRKVDRSIPKALLIDEAWQLLKGGAMAEFVETYARTCRKYGGALITATQSLNDYYKSPATVAALENSDWMVMLQQKAETISDFKTRGRFEMDSHTETILRSLKRNGQEYSDLLIQGPDTVASGRLVIDPYAAVMYSSSPDVYARIDALVVQGVSMANAIAEIAYPDREPSRADSAPFDHKMAIHDLAEAAE